MNTYVVIRNTEQSEVLAKKISGDSSGSDGIDKVLSADSANSVIAFVGKTEQILREIGDEDCTDAIFLIGASNTKLSDEKVAQLIEHGKVMMMISKEGRTVNDETPHVAACAIASLFATYLHPFLCVLMGKIRYGTSYAFRYILDHLNKDQNNKISKSEEDQIQLQPNKIDEEQIRNTFKIIDKDENGFISKDELNEVLTGLGATLTDAELQEVITEVDTNGDGKISLEEFLVMMRKVSKP